MNPLFIFAAIALAQAGNEKNGPQALERPMKLDCFGDPLPAGAILRLGTVRLRQGSIVRSVVYGPDGDWLVSGGSDNEIRVWDGISGKEIVSFRAHDDPLDSFGNRIVSIAVSPKGDLLAGASGSDNCRIHIWSLSQRKKVAELAVTGMRFVKAVAFSPDGKVLACAGLTREVLLWDVATQKVVRRLKTADDSGKAIAFTPDGTILVSANKDKVYLWDAATGRRLKTIEYDDEISSMDISRDGRLVACTQDLQDKKVVLVSVPEGKKLRDLVSEIGLNCVRFSPDGKTLVAGGKHICIWDCAAWSMLRQVGQGGPGCAGSLAFSPDSKTVAAGLALWNLRTGERPLFLAHEFEIQSVGFLPNRSELISAGGDGTFRLWDRTSGKHLRKIELAKGSLWPDTMCFTADGKRLAWGIEAEPIRFCDGASGKEYAQGKAHTKRVNCIVFSPDGRILASGGRDCEIVLWDAAVGKKLKGFQGHEDSVDCIAFLPSGTGLVSGGSDRTIRIWDVKTNRETHRLEGHDERILAVCVSSDGKLVASGSRDNTLRVWDVSVGKEVARLKVGEHPEPACLAFSPDSKILAWADQYETDTSIHLVDMARWKEIHCLKGHRGSVRCLAFSEDGKLVASGSNDTTVLVWDISSVRK